MAKVNSVKSAVRNVLTRTETILVTVISNAWEAALGTKSRGGLGIVSVPRYALLQIRNKAQFWLAPDSRPCRTGMIQPGCEEQTLQRGKDDEVMALVS